MNERIQQLLTQATDDILGVKVVNHNKFAELLVVECRNIAQEYDGAKLSGPGMIIAGRIEQHFGVKQ